MKRRDLYRRDLLLQRIQDDTSRTYDMLAARSHLQVRGHAGALPVWQLHDADGVCSISQHPVRICSNTASAVTRRTQLDCGCCAAGGA